MAGAYDERRETGPDRLWIGDITYVPTCEGWRYLAVLLDAHARRVVGCALADHLRTELALHTLRMALRARRRDSSTTSTAGANTPPPSIGRRSPPAAWSPR